MTDLAKFAFSASDDFNEAAMREAFSHAVPLRTVVIYCYDPRAARIPELVAERLGDIYPGKIILDDKGCKVASTATVFPVVVAGGRAFDALRSITVAQHLFGIENIVVVHHSYCGATTFTADGIIDSFKREEHSDIAHAFPREALCIADYEQSLKSDVALIRKQPGTPKSADIFGFFYEIDSGELILVATDPGEPSAQNQDSTVTNRAKES
jgi:carbonic anhydrase